MEHPFLLPQRGESKRLIMPSILAALSLERSRFLPLSLLRQLVPQYAHPSCLHEELLLFAHVSGHDLSSKLLGSDAEPRVGAAAVPRRR